MATSCMVSGRQPNTCTISVEVSEPVAVTTLDLCICITVAAVSEILSDYAVCAVPVHLRRRGRSRSQLIPVRESCCGVRNAP